MSTDNPVQPAPEAPPAPPPATPAPATPAPVGHTDPEAGQNRTVLQQLNDIGAESDDAGQAPAPAQGQQIRGRELNAYDAADAEAASKSEGAASGEPAKAAESAAATEEEYPDLVDDDYEASPGDAADSADSPDDSAEPKSAAEESLADLKDIPLDDIHKDRATAERVITAYQATRRGREIYESWKQSRTLADPPKINDSGENEGGIGFKPTPDQIKQLHRDSVYFNQLVDHIESGSAEGVERVLGFIAGSDSPTPAATELARSLPRHLAKTNPQALDELESQVRRADMSRWAHLAQTHPEKNQRDFYQGMIESMQWILSGGKSSAQPRAHQSASQTPEQVELERLRAEKAQMEQQLTQRQSQALDAQRASFVDRQYDEMRNYILSKVPSATKILGGEKFAEPVIEREVSRIIDAVADNQQAVNNFDRLVRRSFSTGDPREMERAIKEFRSYATPVADRVIGELKAALRERAGIAARSGSDANNQLHQRLQAQQEHKSVEGGVPANGVPDPSVVTDWDPTKMTQRNWIAAELARL